MSPETSDLEAKLHVLMDVAAGEPRGAVTVAAVRRRVARRRRAASATAAAAFVLVSGLGVAIAAHWTGAGHQATSLTGGGHSRSVTVTSNGGVPRYYLVRSEVPNGGDAANQAQTTVRATATGALRARIRCPVSAPYVVSWPVAPADNQNFFLACQAATGPQSYAKVLDSKIYELHLTSSGRVTRFLPVRGGDLGALLVRSIVATSDGAEIAVIVYPGTHPADLHGTPPDVIVINTRTGTRAIWHGALPVVGKTVYWPQDISLTGDGQRLVFLTQPQCFHAGCTIRGGQQIRVLINPASGGQLNNSGVMVQLNSVLRLSSATVMDAVISPRGSTVTLAVMGTLAAARMPDSVSVVQIPTSGQERLRFVYRLPQGDSYAFLATDASGSELLLGTGTPRGPLAGRIDHGRLIPLGPDPVTVQGMAW